MRSLAELSRLRRAECRMAGPAITQIAAGEGTGVGRQAAAHVAQCLRCQAEVAAYRRVMRTMRTMGGDGADLAKGSAAVVPMGSAAAVLAAFDAVASDGHGFLSGWATRGDHLGGITVATAAAGAAGVLVWLSRRRITGSV